MVLSQNHWYLLGEGGGLPIMDNRMEKKRENEMETGIIRWYTGIRVSQNYGYHFFLGGSL